MLRVELSKLTAESVLTDQEKCKLCYLVGGRAVMSQDAGDACNPFPLPSYPTSIGFIFHVAHSHSWECYLHFHKVTKHRYYLYLLKFHNEQCSHSISGVIVSNMISSGSFTACLKHLISRVIILFSSSLVSVHV